MWILFLTAFVSSSSRPHRFREFEDLCVFSLKERRPSGSLQRASPGTDASFRFLWGDTDRIPAPLRPDGGLLEFLFPFHDRWRRYFACLAASCRSRRGAVCSMGLVVKMCKCRGASSLICGFYWLFSEFILIDSSNASALSIPWHKALLLPYPAFARKD